MGEKLRDLERVALNNEEIIIELNEGESEYGGYDIHIEAGKLRLALSDSEYMKFAFAVSEAKRKLKITKNKE